MGVASPFEKCEVLDPELALKEQREHEEWRQRMELFRQQYLEEQKAAQQARERFCLENYARQQDYIEYRKSLQHMPKPVPVAEPHATKVLREIEAKKATPTCTQRANAYQQREKEAKVQEKDEFEQARWDAEYEARVQARKERIEEQVPVDQWERDYYRKVVPARPKYDDRVRFIRSYEGHGREERQYVCHRPQGCRAQIGEGCYRTMPRYYT